MIWKVLFFQIVQELNLFEWLEDRLEKWIQSQLLKSSRKGSFKRIDAKRSISEHFNRNRSETIRTAFKKFKETMTFVEVGKTEAV